MGSKAESRKFEIGETIMARWPKSNLYFQGKILDFNDIEYLVKFDDEDHSELPIKYKDVKVPFSAQRSRSQSRGRSPAKSPGRKSPGRKSPGRKSPGRKSPARKSPARRSPGRPKRKSAEDISVTDISISPSSKTDLRDFDYDIPTKSVKKQIFADSKEEVRTEVNYTSTVKSRPIITAVRQSTRLASLENKESPYKDGNMINNNLKIDTKSIIEAVETQSKYSKFLSYLNRFAKCIFVTSKSLLVAIMFTIVPFLLTQMCTKKKCDLLHWPDIPRKMEYYYDQKALAIIGGFISCLLILAFIPIGKVAKTKGGSRVRCNGYISLFVLLGVIPLLMKLDYNIVSLYQLYRHFMVSFTALGFVISVLLYIKSFYARRDAINPRGNTGYFVVDFVEGREISPRIGSFDIKFFLYRISILVVVMINVVVVLKGLQSKIDEYSLPLFVVCALQIFYAVDFIWFEESYLTSYEYLKQGCGFITSVSYLNIPFFLITMYSRYILNHRPNLPWYCLVGIAALNLLGYIVFRGANSQKHAFRVNPSNPALAHLESLPTSDGKRLLVSGWWGLVRHPNYIGDIIIQLSWALICGFSHSVPWVVFAFSAIYLVIRTFIVEESCRRKYGLAWSSYVARVPYRLIPKVF